MPGWGHEASLTPTPARAVPERAGPQRYRASRPLHHATAVRRPSLPDVLSTSEMAKDLTTAASAARRCAGLPADKTITITVEMTPVPGVSRVDRRGTDSTRGSAVRVVRAASVTPAVSLAPPLPSRRSDISGLRTAAARTTATNADRSHTIANA